MGTNGSIIMQIDTSWWIWSNHLCMAARGQLFKKKQLNCSTCHLGRHSCGPNKPCTSI